MVNISLRVLSKPDSSVLSQIYRSLGLDWDERVLPSIGNEVLKAVVAQYNAEQLLTQRDRVSRAVKPLTCSCYYASAVMRGSLKGCPMQKVEISIQIALLMPKSREMQVRENLMTRAKEFNILVDDIAITHLSFGTEVSPKHWQNLYSETCKSCLLCLALVEHSASPIGSTYSLPFLSRASDIDVLAMSVQFTKAVESKQVAQQDAERARFVVLKADQVSFFYCLRIEHSAETIESRALTALLGIICAYTHQDIRKEPWPSYSLFFSTRV